MVPVPSSILHVCFIKINISVSPYHFHLMSSHAAPSPPTSPPARPMTSDYWLTSPHPYLTMSPPVNYLSNHVLVGVPRYAPSPPSYICLRSLRAHSMSRSTRVRPRAPVPSKSRHAGLMNLFPSCAPPRCIGVISLIMAFPGHSCSYHVDQ